MSEGMTAAGIIGGVGDALLFVAGVLVIFVVLWDTFETIIVPRSRLRALRLTNSYYKVSWRLWSRAVQRLPSPALRDIYLGAYGPLSLLALLALWALLLILGFALVHAGLGTTLRTPAPGGHNVFADYLYLSGSTFYTLGFGDVTPLNTAGRVVAVTEAGIGFSFLAVVIGYLPVLYQSFSRREVGISLLYARAGVVGSHSDIEPSALVILHRYGRPERAAALEGLLLEWERWAAELLESYLSYPVLVQYRSHHARHSWLAALAVVLDTSALVSLDVEGAAAGQQSVREQARRTHEMAAQVAREVAGIVAPRLAEDAVDRLSAHQWRQLRSGLVRAGLRPDDAPRAEADLVVLRRAYEPYLSALAQALLMPLPPWAPHTAFSGENGELFLNGSQAVSSAGK